MDRNPLRLIRSSDVALHGMDPRELARRTKNGTFRRIRRGFYVSSGEWEASDDRQRHELFLRVAVETTDSRFPLHGLSSAFMLGFPLRNRSSSAHLAGTAAGGGRSQPGIVRHRPDGRDREIIAVRGLPCSDAVNTALDVALHEDFSWGVAILDRLLNPKGLPGEQQIGRWDQRTRTQHGPRARGWGSEGWFPSEGLEGEFRSAGPVAGSSRPPESVSNAGLEIPVDTSGSRRDREAVRHVIEQILSGPKRQKLLGLLSFADGNGFLPGESLSRVAMHAEGFPQPELQTEFRDRAGLIGYTDFFWRDRMLVGEFDGEQKYVKPEYLKGRTVSQVVMAEKAREDRLRRLGLSVIRWTWADVAQPRRLASLLREAGLPASSRPRWTLPS